MAFQKAVKSQSKLRLALFGPSGAGKTYTSLRLAKGIAGQSGRIAVIDTEHGSASKYADRFDFDADGLDLPTVESMVEKINEAVGYDVLIIDSLSHTWQELLEDMDRLAACKYKGNSWSAWKEGTPKQKALVRAILSFPGHIIATMRSKTEWSTEKDERTGKTKPTRTGLAPEQGKGIEYEFDMLMEMTTEHYATVIKDRTGKYQDKITEKPGEDFGAELVAWLNSGAAPTQATAAASSSPAGSAPAPTPAREWNALLAEMGSLSKEKIGDTQAFTAAELAEYRASFDAIQANHNPDLLRVIVTSMKAAIDAKRDAWEKKESDKATPAQAEPADPQQVDIY